MKWSFSKIKQFLVAKRQFLRPNVGKCVWVVSLSWTKHAVTTKHRRPSSNINGGFSGRTGAKKNDVGLSDKKNSISFLRYTGYNPHRVPSKRQTNIMPSYWTGTLTILDSNDRIWPTGKSKVFLHKDNATVNKCAVGMAASAIALFSGICPQ